MATQEYLRRIIYHKKIIRGLLLLLFVGAVSFGIMVISKLDGRVQEVQTAAQSDVLWLASQLQFELLRFENALGLHALGYNSASEVALRFDIAWSRIDVLQHGKPMEDIDKFGTNAEVLPDLKATFKGVEPAIKELITDSLTDEERREKVETILLAQAGYDSSIREFLLSLAKAKSMGMAELRGNLITLSNTLTYLGTTILALLSIFIFLLMLELRASQYAETEMRQLAEEASSAARMKTNFMTIVSHELRTPLTSIIGGLGLLKRRLGDTTKDEAAIKLVNVASRNGDRLLALVNDILDAQALSEGKVHLECKPTDLEEVVYSAVESCSAYASKLNVSYQVITPEEEIKVLTDDARVTQVLVNLISNAVKFTSSGDVVEVRLEKSDHKARIEVTDHGLGIPTHQQNAIFAPFHQVNPGTTGTIQSSGLGLSITKQLIDLLGGEVGFKSVEGEGSTFWIELSLITKCSKILADV